MQPYQRHGGGIRLAAAQAEPLETARFFALASSCENISVPWRSEMKAQRKRGAWLALWRRHRCYGSAAAHLGMQQRRLRRKRGARQCGEMQRHRLIGCGGGLATAAALRQLIWRKQPAWLISGAKSSNISANESVSAKSNDSNQWQQ
jgi:hypothetical protein